MEVPALQAAAAGHGENEPVDAPRHPHPPPEALQAGGRAEEQTYHICAFSFGWPRHGTSHGEPQSQYPSSPCPAWLDTVQTK